jgi:hypothetical protein
VNKIEKSLYFAFGTEKRRKENSNQFLEQQKAR